MHGHARLGQFRNLYAGNIPNLRYDATIRAPIILPYVAMKDTPGLQGKTPNQIVETVCRLPVLPVSFQREKGYIYLHVVDGSALNAGADQEGVELTHGWQPHMMVYAPYFENYMLGGNAFGSTTIVRDDAGAPFAVIYVPLDNRPAVTPQ